MSRIARPRFPAPGHRRPAGTLAIALVLVLGVPHGAARPAAAQPAPADVPVDVDVVEVRRLERSTQLLLELHNDSGRSMTSVGLGDPAFSRIDEVRYNDLSGVRLLDEAAGVEYLPFRNADDKTCICSRMPAMESGVTWTVWWRSAQLPESVETVTVLGPEGQELATGVEVAR